MDICSHQRQLWWPDIKYSSDRPSYSITRKINRILDFWEKQGYYGGRLNIQIAPSEKRGHVLEIHNYERKSSPVEIPMTLENAIMWYHTIDIELEDVRFRMCEHILWVLDHLNIFWSRIIIDAKKGGMSWPMEHVSVSQYEKDLFENSTEVSDTSEIRTVAFPTFVEFTTEKRNSSVLLLPDTGDQIMTTQVHMDYPSISSIWKKSMEYDVGNTEIFSQYIAHARSNSFWVKNLAVRAPRWMKWFAQIILPKRPFGVSPGQVTEVDETGILNSHEPFLSHKLGSVSELLFHSILDKSAPRALTPYHRVWTDIVDRLSHRQDLEVARMIDDGEIETVVVENVNQQPVKV